MIEDYIKYWGLQQHPFLLAPDSRMMHMAGQYYECFERLKYAVNTSKGGALVISEDAGLGKTTLLCKLIDEMKEEYGDSFKYAFVDHPTLTASQLIAHISKSISGIDAGEDKLKNLMILKDTLIDVKKHGGKSIIIVDEGQMLCGNRDVLQELRILINLTNNNEYLHTFILSGQRPLWDEVKSMPEFWQRLPVRYYFVPLKLEETKELVKFRLIKAGLDDDKNIFTDDAFEIIQRYSKGSPRTIIAMADLALLIGYTNRLNRIGFKEISKAINAMSGKGDSLPYVAEERKKKSELSLSSYAEVSRGSQALSSYAEVSKGNQIAAAKQVSQKPGELSSQVKQQKTEPVVRPFFIVLAVVFALIFSAAAGYYFAFMGKHNAEGMNARKEIIEKEKQKQEEPENRQQTQNAVAVKPQEVAVKPQEVEMVKPEQLQKSFVVTTAAANIRKAASINSQKIGLIFEGEIVRIIEEKTDENGQKWYKFQLYGNKEGWVSERAVAVR